MKIILVTIFTIFSVSSFAESEIGHKKDNRVESLSKDTVRVFYQEVGTLDELELENDYSTPVDAIYLCEEELLKSKMALLTQTIEKVVVHDVWENEVGSQISDVPLREYEILCTGEETDVSPLVEDNFDIDAAIEEKF